MKSVNKTVWFRIKENIRIIIISVNAIFSMWFFVLLAVPPCIHHLFTCMNERSGNERMQMNNRPPPSRVLSDSASKHQHDLMFSIPVWIRNYMRTKKKKSMKKKTKTNFHGEFVHELCSIIFPFSMTRDDFNFEHFFFLF